MTTPTADRQPETRSRLERALNVFAPVNGGEGDTVVLMALNVFILLTAYYIIKPVREALILSEWGPEAKIYAAAGQALLLLLLVPAYGKLASLVPRRRLITLVLLFFTGCLVVFYALAHAGVSLGIAFYLWVGIFSLMVIAQFWAFANDIYTAAEGKRLFAIIGFGSSSGAVFGSFITGKLIEPLGEYQLMLLSGALLLISLVLTALADSRRHHVCGLSRPADTVNENERTAEAEAASTGTADEPIKGRGGFALLLRNRYLMLIALMMILANLINTTGEYLLGERVTSVKTAAVPEVVHTAEMSQAQYTAAVDARESEIGRAIGGFYADFFAIVNLVSMLTQLFLVSRIVRWLGVARAVMVLPLVAMGGYALIAVFPALAVTRWAKTAENATDYSLQNTVRNILFLPTTRQEKYKAKQAIDTFCVRIGDVLAALVVLGGTTALHLRAGDFALVNVALAAGWLVLAFFIGRRFNRLSG